MDWLGIGILMTVAAGATVQIITGTGFALVCAPFLLLMLGHDVGVRAGAHDRCWRCDRDSHRPRDQRLCTEGDRHHRGEWW
jgi:hypothetical protein